MTTLRPTQAALATLPDAPGVYVMRGTQGAILYVGKATDLKRRVGSYFRGAHDTRIQRMVSAVRSIVISPTSSALEALLLEAEMIKKYQPPYNVMAKDDKTFAAIAITDEPIPRVIVTRPTTRQKVKLEWIFGPYTSTKTAKTALEIIRRIFPFHSSSLRKPTICFDASIGLCSGVCGGKQSIAAYWQSLARLRLLLMGKRQRLLRSLERAMREHARAHRFEEAARIRDQLFALKHIRDVAILNRENWSEPAFEGLAVTYRIPRRIEAYDISHIFGQDAVGSMVVFTNGKVDSTQYRKFHIRWVKSINDPAMIQEVLTRRLNHPEWPFPDLILIDGGRPQLYAAQHVVKTHKLTIPVAALAKGLTRKKADLYCSDAFVKLIPLSLLIKLREEAHRFAIRYHRQLKRKGLFR